MTDRPGSLNENSKKLRIGSGKERRCFGIDHASNYTLISVYYKRRIVWCDLTNKEDFFLNHSTKYLSFRQLLLCRSGSFWGFDMPENLATSKQDTLAATAAPDKADTDGNSNFFSRHFFFLEKLTIL